MLKNKMDTFTHEKISPMSKFEKFVYIILISLGTYLFLRYFLWWIKPEHIPLNWSNSSLHIFDISIFAVLTFIIFFGSLLIVATWFTIIFIKRPKHINPPSGLKVAFITCFVPGKEPISMLRETLVAMREADYPHDTWVLDEGNNQEVKDLCKELKVKHFSRKDKKHYNLDDGPFKAKTKAGNLNSWRNEHEYEYDIVAQLDMDHVPHKDYLTKQLGYFTDPKVGYVVAPQIYKNTENWISRGAAEQTYYYYGPLQQGFYGNDMPFLIGTTHVYRVVAMKSFGGYSPNIAEDYLTSLHFSSHGWKGVYVPEILAKGIGPTTWVDYLNQQMRWSYGLYDILAKHTHRHFFKLKILQKVNLFFSQMFYFTGLASVFGFVLTTLYLLFGINSSNMSFIEWLYYSLPAYFSSYLVLSFLHRYYINPKDEPIVGMAGVLLSQAASIIYSVALFRFILRKSLTYKITAKGDAAETNTPISSLNTHLMIFIVSVITLFVSLLNHNDSIIMRFWAILNILFTGVLIFLIYWDLIKERSKHVLSHYNFFEFGLHEKTILPKPPNEHEKLLYIKDLRTLYTFFSIVSFGSVQISMFQFISSNPLMWPLFVYFGLTVIYFFVSILVNSFSKGFKYSNHIDLINKWKGKFTNSVDIFLPTAGEPIEILGNTWKGVTEMINSYKGKTTVYCLDDSDRIEVKKLAKLYNFNYIVRPNRGWFKKAGNLKHGFEISNGEFITIFDADFTPRKDFLDELIPYFLEYKHVGIVQSPQYFDVSPDQNWLQRGAGAVQELFYRFCQVSRQNHNASICVGTNAVYRRIALNDTGGTALIEHSEDVHTGFNLRAHGWSIQYVPLILAKGLCPSEIKAFFKQQYRWCLGSMSLLSSKKFWGTKMSFMSRLSYFSGYLYYIHTAISSFFIPIIPIVLLTIYQNQISLHNYVYILPSLIFIQIIYPIWHVSVYGIEAWSTRVIYGWAHFFAIIDSVTGKTMSWQASGSKITSDDRYTAFRVMQFLVNFIPAILWIALSARYMYFVNLERGFPLLLGGLYFFAINSKVTLFELFNINTNIEIKK